MNNIDGNPNTVTNTVDAPILKHVEDPNTMLSTPLSPIEFNAGEFDEIFSGIQAKHSFIPIPEDGKGGGSRRRKNVARRVKTCTRCDFVAAVFGNGTHGIHTPIVLPYYKERPQ